MASTNDSMQKHKSNQNIQVFARVRPINAREKLIKSNEIVEVQGLKDVIVKQTLDSRTTKKFSFDRAFGMNSQQHEVYQTVVAPLIQEVIDGYNCTVFAYGQTGTGKTYTMVGEEQSLLSSQYDDISNVGMIPRALTHLFDKLRLDKNEFAMRVSYLELYNEELCDLLSTDDTVKIRVFDDINKKGSVIVQGLEEIPVRCKDDVYKLLAKGQERRKTAATLMNAQSSRSHTVFSILIHIKENGSDGEEMLKIGKLNLVDLAGSENISKAGNEKGIRTRESVNINKSLLTLGRVITALVERAPHIPYRESNLTRLLQESLGGRTKTSIIATISSGHKDMEETLSTLDYAHRAKNIQNKPEINQRLTKKVILKEYTEEIDKLKRDLLAAREKNGIYLATESYNDMVYKMENTEKELNEIMGAFTKLKEELNTKMKLFEETKQSLAVTAEQLLITEGKFKITESELSKTKRNLKKTKRYYTEAKHLIACHQDTEQKLTEQTKEIIKVAEQAANDTKSLQESIRRRKEKDENASAVSNNLMNTLNNRIKDMQNEILQLERSHKESSDIIVADLNAHMESNGEWTTGFIESIKGLYNIQKNFQSNFITEFQKWVSNKNDNNADFMSFVKYFQAMKEKEETFCNSMNEKIDRMLKLLSDRKCEEIKLGEQIIKKIDEQRKTNDNFGNYLQTKFNHYCNELDSLRSTMELKNASKNSKLHEMERLINEMKALAEDEVIIDRKLLELHEDVKSNGITATTKFVESSQIVSNEMKKILEDNSTLANEDYDKTVREMESISSVLKENDLHQRKSIETQLNNLDCFEQEIRKQLNAFETNFKNEQDNVIQNIRDESSRTTIKLREIKSVVQHNLHMVVEETENKILKNVQETTENIEEFKKGEVYMYRSTGETPVRKDYKFNRNLNSTSPHDRIIRRLRLEQGFSDSLLHDSSIAEEDEVENFSSREVANSTAIHENTAIETHHSNNKIMQENLDVN